MTEWDRVVSSTSMSRTSPSGAVRVLLAEDQPLLRLGLTQVIEREPHRVALVGVVTRYRDLAGHPALAETDVLLLDQRMRDEGGDIVPSLITRHGLNVVLLADEDNPRLHHDIVARGAMGVVLKHRPLDELLNAIEHVHAGEAWLERSLIAKLIKARAGEAAAPARTGPEPLRQIQMLTQKERQLIVALVEHRGAKNFTIAESLGISERTLRNRLTVVYDKLRVHGKLNLYLYAVEHGLGAMAQGSVHAGDGGLRVLRN